MIGQDAARRIHALAMASIESLTEILRSSELRDDADLYPILHRAVGELIGETQMRIIEKIVAIYPELDDL